MTPTLRPAYATLPSQRSASLLGRRVECETLDQLAADVAGGTSRVLLLRGGAGSGKSALLAHLATRIQGWRVTSAFGVESEMELAHSGLHQLCSPLLNRLDEIPPPQRDALRIVFGLSDGPAPDRFLVGLATVSLIAQAAEERPLACIVDDAQWLDRASAQTLAFVARRLLAERVALVGAMRPGPGDDVFAGLPVLPVRQLGEADSRALLQRTLTVPLDPAVRDQIVAESHGNPLAVLELPRTWDALRLAGGFGLPDGRPVTGLIEEGYLDRYLRLPEETRLLVLTAAADPRGDPVLLRRAATTLGVDLAAITPAADDGLVQVRGRVEFAHPLVRSAVYGAAPGKDRRRVHRALAEATDGVTDPDRRAWHRARGASGPDEDVAADLERSAGRAQARGGLAAAAAFLTRAAELTPEPPLRQRRRLDAAFAHLDAGSLATAQDLLDVARREGTDELQQARADLLRARLAFVSRRARQTAPLLAGRRPTARTPGSGTRPRDVPGRVLRRSVSGQVRRRLRRRRPGARRARRSSPAGRRHPRRRPAARGVRRADRGLPGRRTRRPARPRRAAPGADRAGDEERPRMAAARDRARPRALGRRRRRRPLRTSRANGPQDGSAQRAAVRAQLPDHGPRPAR